ncbi:RHS repeat-associated core domain-containing protein [Paenibacillus alvei]|uniref:RHS repeat-associated core domain-containing protein n=1 Tax=Paenibacillus alvei TaxID=44250 RepID=UPI0022820008|nr:RHS repeat-associated core domain-containing protein [Paenibacillus alvei]MCY7487505.1 polymorphic toxin type 44 domain-containing protein [Paenibacillus alvei]
MGADTLHDKKSLSYDALGRVTRIYNETWNKAVQFAYDAAGNRTAVTDPEKRTITYTYDVLNRLTSMTDPDDFATKFAYDKVGALTSIERPNGINTTYTYNANHWMTGLENRGNFTHNSFTYEYDKVGNIKSQVEEDGARTTYAYDPLDRVSKVEYPQAKNAEILKIYDLPFKKAYRNWSPYSYRNAMVTPSKTVEYTYDKDGNRLTMREDGKTTTYKYDPAGRMIQAGKEQFKYDANGNLIKQSGGKQGHVTYSYTGYNKLKSVQYDDRSKVEYEYDAFLDKIARTESLIDPRQQAGQEEALTKQRMYYLNDGLNVMKEYGENLEPIAQYYEANGQIISRRAFQYTGRDNIDVPLNKRSRPQVRGMLRGDMTYYLHDQLGSVTHITDRTGETLEQYRYEAFGSLMTPITPEYNTIGYTGQILDPKTGLMDYNARWYNPNVGRFTTEDTYKGTLGNPMSQNGYTYVENNPLIYIDPTGHKKVSDNDYLINLVEEYTNSWVSEKKAIKYFSADLKTCSVSTLCISAQKNIEKLKEKQKAMEIYADAVRTTYYKLHGLPIPNDVKYQVAINAPDITKKLNELMLKYEYIYIDEASKHENIKTADFFYTVRGKSELDLKNQPGWKGYKYYVYEGELVRRDQPGNISYGYLGKVFGFTDKKLFFAAGAAQKMAGTSLPEWNGPPTYGDDPFDSFNVKWGIEIYNKWHNKRK